MNAIRFGTVLLLGMVAAAAAHAQPRSAVRDHDLQGVVNVTIGPGWYLVAPYDKNDPDKMCGWDAEHNEAEAVCTGRSNWTLDILAGFGVRPGLELLLMYRQGLESPQMGRPQSRSVGAGIKAYKPADGLFKISLGVFPLFDFSEGQADIGGDFVIHVPVAAHFDIVRWFGAYAQVAPNLSFVREFRLDVGFGVGVQGRFP